MNCQTAQAQILGLPDPRELPAPLRDHVVGCAACRAWARRAARLEGLLERLPVPPAPAGKKEAVLDELTRGEPVIQPMVAGATRPGPGLVALRFLRRNASYVGGLAAAVLVAVGVYALWPSKGPVAPEVVKTQKDPLLEQMVAANAAMARAATPARRLEVLGGMADALAADTRAMARLAGGADLTRRAGQYENVIRDGLVLRAREIQNATFGMTPDDWAKLESLADKLGADAAAADALAKEVPQDALPALARLAGAAREGEKVLRATRGSK